MMSLLPNGGFGVKAVFAVAAFGFGAMCATVIGLSPEDVVAGRFAQVLEGKASANAEGSTIQVAGTEDFWLRSSRVAAAVEPAAWSHGQGLPLAFAVGDKVTVTREGASRAFKVVSVSAPFKDGEAVAVRVTATDVTDEKAAPVVFTVPASQKSEATKPRAS